MASKKIHLSSDDFARLFFIKRFKKSPDYDKSYFSDWQRRFNHIKIYGENPSDGYNTLGLFDDLSLKAYKDLKKKYIL